MEDPHIKKLFELSDDLLRRSRYMLEDDEVCRVIYTTIKEKSDRLLRRCEVLLTKSRATPRVRPRTDGRGGGW